jgi:hypothetical protein
MAVRSRPRGKHHLPCHCPQPSSLLCKKDPYKCTGSRPLTSFISNMMAPSRFKRRQESSLRTFAGLEDSRLWSPSAPPAGVAAGISESNGGRSDGQSDGQRVWTTTSPPTFGGSAIAHVERHVAQRGRHAGAPHPLLVLHRGKGDLSYQYPQASLTLSIGEWVRRKSSTKKPEDRTRSRGPWQPLAQASRIVPPMPEYIEPACTLPCRSLLPC